MKLLVMCEGPNELEIMKILLRHRCLKFTNDDLLNLVPYHARQISNSGMVQAALNLYPDKVKVLRIGDSLNEKMKIPKNYENKIMKVEKYCTKPELEMLLIIAEQMLSEFDKVKSKKKPKQFAKEKIKCNRKRYDNSSKFYAEYFDGNVQLLVDSIREYKRVRGTHKKDELYLADLLREDMEFRKED